MSDVATPLVARLLLSPSYILPPLSNPESSVFVFLLMLIYTTHLYSPLI